MPSDQSLNRPPWSWFRRLSLRLTLIVFVLLPVAALLVPSGWLSTHLAERWSEERLEEELELISRALREPASRAVDREDTVALEGILEAAFQFNRVYSAYVYDRDGRRLAVVGAGDADARESQLAELAAEGDRQGEFGTVEGREVYSYFAPLTDAGGRIIGLFQVTRRASDFQEQAQYLRNTILAVLTALALLLILLVWLGHHLAVGRPLARLTDSMAAVGSGDLSHRADVAWPDELARLGAAFNRMLDEIESAEKEIADRRAHEDALQNRLRQAETMASVGRLAAGVAHELGTPLAVIDGRAQRLNRDERGGDGEIAESLKTIRSQVARMSHIVRQLLDFGHQYHGYRSRTSVASLAGRALEHVRDDAERRGVTLRLEPGPRSCMLDVDPERVEEAITHLLRNALQSTEPGGTVRLRWEQDAEQVAIRVEDDGPGVPADLADRVFEPFFTTKRVGEGSGLGLSVVHGVVEQHGGSVEVEPSSLGGAGFVVRLPVHTVDAEGEQS